MEFLLRMLGTFWKQIVVMMNFLAVLLQMINRLHIFYHNNCLMKELTGTDSNLDKSQGYHAE